jgi:anti-sigma factor RsiW
MTDETRTRFGNTPDDHAFLSGYLDGELTVVERAEVEAQLAASGELRAELEEIAVARAALRGLPRRDAPAGFWDAVLANVGAAEVDQSVDEASGEPEGATVVAIESRRNRRSLAGWIAGAAAVAAAVIAVILVPGRTAVHPNVTAVVTQHGAATSNVGDSISSLVPMGPLAGRR